MYHEESLPFPLGRFQSEGGEHANYDHNCFYYNHTTRHGGRHKVEPIMAILNNMYKRLSYSIQQDTTPDGISAAEAFCQYKVRHMAACKLQKHVRGWLVRQILRRAQWVPLAETADQKLAKRDAIVKRRERLDRKHGNVTLVNTSEGKPSILKGYNFVLVGTVPKLGNKKYSQADFRNLVVEHGGRVKKKVPQGSGKGASTKKYVVLVEKVAPKKIPTAVRNAMRAGHDVLSYKYVHACISQECIVEKQPFAVDLRGLKVSLVKNVSLESLIKGPRRRRFCINVGKRRIFEKRIRPGKSAGHYYVLQCRREISKLQKMDFRRGRSILKELH